MHLFCVATSVVARTPLIPSNILLQYDHLNTSEVQLSITSVRSRVVYL